MSVVELTVAVSPAKGELLALIEDLRRGVEDGSVIALVALPIHPDLKWSTRSAGEIRMLELAGMLGCAWQAACDRLKGDVG
jgi:hypothetical protein